MSNNTDNENQVSLVWTSLFLVFALYLILYTNPVFGAADYFLKIEKRQIREYMVNDLINKTIEEHNKKHVLHQINIDSLTFYQFAAITNPCTAWDWRERAKCRKPYQIYIRSY